MDELASQIYSKEKKLDLLLSAAGINYNLSPVNSIKEDEFRESFEINLLSNLKLLKSFQPLLKSSNESKIIVISSQLESKIKPFWGGNDSLVSGLHKMVLTFAEENKTNPYFLENVEIANKRWLHERGGVALKNYQQ